MISPVEEQRAGDVVYLSFYKAFNTISYNIIPGKLMQSQLGKADSQVHWKVAHRVVISSTKSIWRPVTKDQPQGLTLGLILFNFFI